MNYTSLRSAGTARFVRAFALLVAVAMLAGCGSIGQLRKAQTAFSQAAALDNAAQLATKSATNYSDAAGQVTAAVSRESAKGLYWEALSYLTNFDASAEGTLRQANLWGTKLTVEAMCYWKLGLYTEAQERAQQAKENATNLTMFSRDRALLMALPGLVKIDYSYDLIPARRTAGTDPKFSQVKDLLVDPRYGAIKNIQNAFDMLPPHHPLAPYLINSALAAFRNLQEASFRMNGGASLTPPDLDKVNEWLKKLAAEPGHEEMIKTWKGAFGIL